MMRGWWWLQGQRVQRIFWAWMPERWLRQHILNSERRWSGKGMDDEELTEYAGNAREFRWRYR